MIQEMQGDQLEIDLDQATGEFREQLKKKKIISMHIDGDKSYYVDEEGKQYSIKEFTRQCKDQEDNDGKSDDKE